MIRALAVALLLAVAAEPAAAADLLGATEVNGRTAPQLRKATNASIRAYAFDGTKARPIPFQVDERDHRQRLVIDRGPEPNPDDSPGVFDENDAVVFRNRDLGVAGATSSLPAGADRWLEVRVGDEKTPLGFVYLGTFASPPALAPDPGDVKYDWGADQVLARRYAVGFDGPLPNHIAFVDRMGDRGENLLSSVRAAGEARLFGGLITIRRDESSIEVEREGYRTGPVRAIRRGNYWIRLPLGFRARGRVDLLFYADFVAVRALAKIKIPPSLVPGDGEMTAAFDFKNLDGATLVVDGTDVLGAVDGTLGEGERAIQRRESRWAALKLPKGGAFVLGVKLEGGLASLDQRVLFDDSATRRPRLGYELSKVSRLSTGEHPLNVVGMVIGDPSRTAEAAAMILKPPAVTVRAVAQPTASEGSRASTTTSSSANK